MDDPEPPQEFRDAVQAMRDARLRPEILAEEMPSPQRIAPYSCALAADLTVDGEDVGGGRLVLLHDPDGNDAWEGTFRLVAYARAEIDPEQAADPMLAGRRLELADRGPRGARCRVRRTERHRHLRLLGVLRGPGGRGRHRPDRDPRLVDPARERRHRPRRARGGLG